MYDKSRDELVNSLLTKVTDLQQKANTVPEDTTRLLDGLSITQWKTRAQQEESLRLHLEAVNERQQLFIRDLQKALHQYRTGAHPQPQAHKQQSQSEDSDQIELLKNQVQVFSEDFQHERKDRERAQERIVNLEEQVELLSQQLANAHARDSILLAETHDNTTTTLDAYHEEYARQMEMQQMYNPICYQSRLIPHGTLQEDSLVEDAHGSMEALGAAVSGGATCSSAATLQEQHGHRQGTTTTTTTTTTTPAATPTPTTIKAKDLKLECPKCSSLFPANNPLAFLEHNDTCSVE